MATSPRLKYPFVAGIGMTVYLVTTNVTAAKMAAAASSRVLITSPSLVLDFAPKAKTPELGRPGGTQAPIPRSLRLIRTYPVLSRQAPVADRSIYQPTWNGAYRRPRNSTGPRPPNYGSQVTAHRLQDYLISLS